MTSCAKIEYPRCNDQTLLENGSNLMPKSAAHLKHTPIFDWRVVRCETKNRHQKNM